MGMTITLVIVSFIIMLMPADNVSRTGTAVFIPLTILALQLTLADKIPVVGYYTLMDFFFLLCFITSMLVSIESGLVYCLITSKSPNFYDWMDNKFNILKNHKENESTAEETCNDKDSETNEFVKVIDELNDVRETNTDTSSLNETNTRNEILSIRSKSYNEGMKLDQEIRRRVNESEMESNGSGSKRSLRDEYLEENNIQKVINYDDKMLYLREDQMVINSIINKSIKKFDNIIRIFLPSLFFILIIVIMSYEN